MSLSYRVRSIMTVVSLSLSFSCKAKWPEVMVHHVFRTQWQFPISLVYISVFLFSLKLAISMSEALRFLDITMIEKLS